LLSFVTVLLIRFRCALRQQAQQHKRRSNYKE
jgi:hypothetical protein